MYVARAIGVGRTLYEDDRVRLLAKYEEPYATFTDKLDEALVFASSGDALDLIGRVYSADPVRADGKPNRPLTAYFWTIAPVESALEAV